MLFYTFADIIAIVIEVPCTHSEYQTNDIYIYIYIYIYINVYV